MEQLRRRSDLADANNSALVREMSASNSDKNQEISQVRAELKMRSFELTALGATFEVQ